MIRVGLQGVLLCSLFSFATGYGIGWWIMLRAERREKALQAAQKKWRRDAEEIQ